VGYGGGVVWERDHGRRRWVENGWSMSSSIIVFLSNNEGGQAHMQSHASVASNFPFRPLAARRGPTHEGHIFRLDRLCYLRGNNQTLSGHTAARTLFGPLVRQD